MPRQVKIKGAFYKGVLLSNLIIFTAPPEVRITTESAAVNVDANLNCTVRRNPENFTYSWSYDGIILSNELSPLLTNLEEVGNYTCEVTSPAGVGMDSIYVGLGGKQVTTVGGACLRRKCVERMCSLSSSYQTQLSSAI